MEKETVLSLYKEYVMPTYFQTPLVLVKGKGSKVYDIDGKEYLDFFPGWAVSGIGHCHKKVIDSLRKQSKKILHVSNNYLSIPQALLAKKIIEHSFPGKVFFANSGAEANEGAIKLARKFGSPKGKFEIITMFNSFHGRTLATITATGQEKVKIGFEPLVAGFKHVPFNDFVALENAITDKTIAIMLEPIQGEGGINVANPEYLKNVRRLCDEKGLLLIFDEIQTGVGRTGKMFCFQNYGVSPDIMTLAKSLGGGLPIGAMVAKKEIADILSPGTHASTFGGSPVVCAASLAVFEVIEKGNLLRNAEKNGKYLMAKLENLKKRYSIIKEVRGIGLMIGVELSMEGDAIYKQCLEKGLLINCTQKNILRIMPPINVKRGEINKALNILNEVLKNKK